jgi:hypothetical protein
MAREQEKEGVMSAKRLSTLSDAEVMTQARELAREERQVREDVLLYLEEVRTRGLPVPASCSSYFDELALEDTIGEGRPAAGGRARE